MGGLKPPFFVYLKKINAMNAIQLKNKIDFYNNVSQTARFYNYEYDDAVNVAMLQYINARLGDGSNRTPELYQQIKDDIFTLVKTAAVTFTSGTALTNQYYTVLPATGPVPSDYRDFVLLMCLIDGYTTYARPTDYNKLGPLFEDSFRHPTNVKPYFSYQTTGLSLYRSNSGTLTSATLTYVKTPNSFTIGVESQLIDGGPAVTLTNGAVYYATEPSVYNGVEYNIGATITGVTAQLLTSGQVILALNTTPCELPPKAHDDIAQLASAIMLKSISDFNGSSAIQSEVNTTS